MSKFYIISDVHGFYYEMREALNEAGFDPNDENSWLVSLGDEIDRGPNPGEVIDYLMNLPRAIFIKGNHQLLMEQMLKRGYAAKHDWSNGTMRSVLELAPEAQTADEGFEIAYRKLKPFFDQTINYLELNNHIFVHSWIPVINTTNLPMYSIQNGKFEFNPNWRNASDLEWEDSFWGNPYLLAEQGLLPDKQIIFGHYHTSFARHRYDNEPEWGLGANFDPYYGKGYIGIDGCCAYSGKINCLVLEDDFINGKGT